MVETYSFGEWMKHRRKELRLSQQAVASAVFCSRTMIKKIEADERRPSKELAQLLARVLLISEDQLDIFVECARGMRPIDELSGEPEPGWEKSMLSPIMMPASLPLPATLLIGRTAELDKLERLFSHSWLVTVVGPGGVGKTRLALAAAGAWQKVGGQTAFVSLAELDEAGSIVPTVNAALGIPQSPYADPKDQLLSYLSQKTVLLVLDNFEHLLDGVDLLAQMRQASASLTLLVTSRQRLNLPDEQLFPLEGLAYPQDPGELAETADGLDYPTFPAIQLFLDTARRLIPDYTPQVLDDLVALGRITEGLPLALELAATWVDTLPLSDLISEMERNLDILTQNQPQRPTRHHSIRAVFDTTWQLLTTYEQQAFAQTAVFRGGFTRQAATAAGVTLPLLSSLVGRHLIQLDQKNGRYTSHELMRQYGLEKLGEYGELENARKKHLAFYLEQAITADANLRGPDQIVLLNQLEAEQDNFRAALTWSLSHALPDAARLTLSLSWYWRIRNQVIEGRRWLSEVLTEGVGDSAVNAALHFHAGHMAWMQGDFVTARMHQEISGGLWQSLGEEGVNGLAYSLHALGMVANQEGKIDEAQDHFEASLGLFEQSRDEWGSAFNRSWLGLTLIKLGNLKRAKELLGQSLAAYRQIGDQWAKGLALTQLAYLEWELQNWDMAYLLADEASQNARELGHWHSLGATLELKAQIAQKQGDLEKAKQLFEESLNLFINMGNERITAEIQGLLDALPG